MKDTTSEQVVFDKVVGGLLKQGELSKEEDGVTCKYRQEKEGRILRCGIGQLIPDDLYDPDFEGRVVGDLPVELLKAIAPGCRKSFLESLQGEHDCSESLDEAMLAYKEMAAEQGLEWSFN